MPNVNSGRKNKFRSNYLDIDNDPLYPFGYGLSYTTFRYGDLQLSNNSMNEKGKITASVTVTNTGNYDADEIVQMYIRDMVGSVARPVKELKEYLRPVTYIPETKSIDTLFKEMQSTKNHMVIVLDEYGQTSGLVAMEDILEEIVGNILDEYDEEDEMIQKQNDGSMIANGLTELEDLEDLIPVTFDKEDYETLNGFLIDELEHIPGEDEKCVVDYEGYRFTALQVDNNIIQTVKIEKLPEA